MKHQDNRLDLRYLFVGIHNVHLASKLLSQVGLGMNGLVKEDIDAFKALIKRSSAFRAFRFLSSYSPSARLTQRVPARIDKRLLIKVIKVVVANGALMVISLFDHDLLLFLSLSQHKENLTSC